MGCRLLFLPVSWQHQCQLWATEEEAMWFLLTYVFLKAPGPIRTVRPWISSQHSVCFSSPKRDLYCNAVYWLVFILPENSSQKKQFLYSNVFINTINAKKLCLSHKVINIKSHDMIYSDYEWKSFLAPPNKHDFSSELFSNLLILSGLGFFDQTQPGAGERIIPASYLKFNPLELGSWNVVCI